MNLFIITITIIIIIISSSSSSIRRSWRFHKRAAVSWLVSRRRNTRMMLSCETTAKRTEFLVALNRSHSDDRLSSRHRIISEHKRRTCLTVSYSNMLRCVAVCECNRLVAVLELTAACFRICVVFSAA